MPNLVTTSVSNVKEDLADVISRITPEKTPFWNEIGKTTAKNTFHEFLNRELAPPMVNAAAENAAFAAADGAGPDRLGNHTQIFTKVAGVSGTLESVDSAGYKSAISDQVAIKMAELKRDIEFALVSASGSQGGSTRRLAGAEAWISTNADHGTGGSTPGYANQLVGNVTAGTTRPLTEDMFNDMMESVWNEGGNASKVLVCGSLKQAISKFSGGATKYQDVNKNATIYGAVDTYVSDFGTHSVIPHHFMPKTTVLAIDPSLWSVATLRKITKTELPKTKDSVEYSLLTELTLVSKNERGNGKIADVTAA
ncbi:SU10 major capsid protein [Agrobacterium rosae]|uniref:Head protein n=1 Tax=Agrobacterium rosae TaxID=1972867 RepID=A0A1R3TIY3_9HYPH|nr:DUF5309 family protein [Agrobacterium rosae]SCX19663.1 hypothetical protein DSM25559_1877 [Agrobacterium rosae]